MKAARSAESSALRLAANHFSFATPQSLALTEQPAVEADGVSPVKQAQEVLGKTAGSGDFKFDPAQRFDEAEVRRDDGQAMLRATERPWPSSDAAA